MIDIHCHILPGIDDGSQSWETSIGMAQMAYEDGIRHIIATPHFNDRAYNPPTIVKPLVKELQGILDHKGIDITIHAVYSNSN
jgi:protein-tyrosine phosphatase